MKGVAINKMSNISTAKVNADTLNIRKRIVELFNSKEYQELKTYYSHKSFFDILGIMRNENIHSNFLAWILDPKQSHGLNFYSIRKFLEMLIIAVNDCSYCKEGKELFPDELIDFIITGNYEVLDVDVEREKVISNGKRIDIFISILISTGVNYSDKTKIKIILENKVYSKEHTDQTIHYFNWAKKEYGSDNKLIFVYLTPASTNELLSLLEQQCKCKEYIQVNYQYVVNYILEPCRKQDLPNEANTLIDNYLRCLSYPSVSEEEYSNGGMVMATSERERKLLLDFWETNKSLLLAMLNVLKDDENIDEDERDNMQKMISTMSNQSNKDYTQYEFAGKKFRKNRLVYAVVSEYLKMRKNCTYEELKKVFSDDIQGSLGVVQKIDVVNSKDPKRYFSKPGETLRTIDGVEFAVCNQWAIANIKKLLSIAREEGFVITEV